MQDHIAYIRSFPARPQCPINGLAIRRARLARRPRDEQIAQVGNAEEGRGQGMHLTRSAVTMPPLCGAAKAASRNMDGGLSVRLSNAASRCTWGC